MAATKKTKINRSPRLSAIFGDSCVGVTQLNYGIYHPVLEIILTVRGRCAVTGASGPAGTMRG